jgi:NADPH:quinone reductase-like Zn-dependent oxidoreductase
MKAVVMTGYGGVEVLELTEVPDPVAGPGQVVVDIFAASVNAADYKVRLGHAHYGQLTLPHILGRDFSGMVSAVGDGADLELGEEVFAVTRAPADGAYAEKIAIQADIVARKPPGLGHDEAAALALVGITAQHALEEAARLRRGETILIQGGAGGVGGFGIQLAKHIGAHVVTTASAANADYVRELGADRVIDYQSTDFTTQVAGCDVVFDTVGGDVQQRSAAVIRPGGRLVCVAPGPELASPSRSDISVLRPDVFRDRAHLDRIGELRALGAVWPPALTRFDLADAARAHELSQGRHLRGKLILRMR